MLTYVAERPFYLSYQVEAGLTVTPIPRITLEPSLEEKDMAILSRYVEKTYLNPSAASQILKRFKQDKSILLHSFLLPEHVKEIRRLTQERDVSDNVGGTHKPSYQIGFGHGWEPVGPPHKQRYLRFTSSSSSSTAKGEACPCGSLLERIRCELFASGAFARLLEKLTGLQVSQQSSESRRFRPGLDYTLAHYGILTVEPKLDVSICFVKDEKAEDQEVWESGDVGGFGCYIKVSKQGPWGGMYL